MKTIASRQNPLVARFRAAANNDNRAVVLLDGAHLVADAMGAGLAIEEAVVASGHAETPDVARLLASLDAHGVPLTEATSAVMAALSPVRSTSAIVALAARPVDGRGAILAAPTIRAVIACGVQDPGNVGAIVRAAEASGATGFFTAGESADPFAWKALRGSMGSALRLPIGVAADVMSLIADLRARGCRVVAAVPRGGTPLFDARLDGSLAIVVGSEGAGLPASVSDGADLRVTIPMRGPVESLNTAVSAALLLFEAMRQER